MEDDRIIYRLKFTSFSLPPYDNANYIQETDLNTKIINIVSDCNIIVVKCKRRLRLSICPAKEEDIIMEKCSIWFVWKKGAKIIFCAAVPVSRKNIKTTSIFILTKYKTFTIIDAVSVQSGTQGQAK
jgi:hypothetical protein